MTALHTENETIRFVTKKDCIRKIMDYQDIITFIMEIMGTVAFAASGAMVGMEKKMDIFGVCILGVVTAVGGGMILDIVLGIIPPSVFQNSIYALTAVVTSCIVFLVLYYKKGLLEGSRRVTYDRIMLVMDSIGLGIFTVVGVNRMIRMKCSMSKSSPYISRHLYGRNL